TYTTTPTILDGENVRRPLRITGNKAIIQYMTIRNGNATNAVSAHMGGGILVAQADDVTLRGLTLIHNTASTTDNTLSTGGGIALAGDASLLIEHSLILSNTTIFAGGGIGLRAGAVEQAVLTLKSSVIAHNDANAGGAIGTAGSGRSHINVYHTTFADNGGPA